MSGTQSFISTGYYWVPPMHPWVEDVEGELEQIAEESKDPEDDFIKQNEEDLKGDKE